MPATGDHFQTAERLTDSRPGLVAKDRAQQELTARHPTDVRCGGEHCRHDDRVTVERRERMIVVQLETLNEAGIEHRGRGGAGGASTPADQQGAARVIEGRDGLNALARDGKLSAHKGAGDAVKQQVLRVFTYGLRNVIQRNARDPGGEPPRWSVWIGGGATRLFGRALAGRRGERR